MECVFTMTEDEPLMIWNAKARDTLRRKLGPIGIGWVATVMEITEPKPKTS